MRNSVSLTRTMKPVVAIIFVAASLVGMRAAAQIKNPIQAAKDAYNKAKQQQQQGQQGQQPAPQTTSQPAGAPAQPTTSAAAQPASAPAQTTAPTPAEIPAAPAGGINPSKLPDIQGIHLGMSPDDLLPKLKVLYPGTGFITPAKMAYMNAPDKPWIAAVSATFDCGLNPNPSKCNGDQFRVRFSAPPSKQVTVYLQRGLNFVGSGQFPTQQTLIAALTQKYGPNPMLTNPANPGILTWAFDEQGQPVVPTAPKTKVGCVTSTTLSPFQGIQSYATGQLPFSQADINRMVTMKCALGVYVVADMGPGNGGVVQAMTVTLVENSEDLRDAIAVQQYLDNVNNAQQQQQLKNAQQQSGPKL